MKISFDISALNPEFKEHSIRGIGRYVKKLYGEICNKDFEILPFDQTKLILPYQKNIINSLPLGKQSVRQQIFMPARLRALKKSCDFIHFPSHTDCPVLCPQPYMITVLDLIYLVCKDLYDQGNYRARFARMLEMQAIKQASMLLAISECTANDIHNLLGIPYEKIRVTYLGVDETFFTFKDEKHYEDEFRKKYNLSNDTKIILYVGGIDQRKNYKTIVKTLASLRDALKEEKINFKLVMVGKIKQDRQYPIYKEEIKKYNVEDLVVETDFLEDEVLKSLYGFSSLLFFPTLYEGFGLTALEAMARGLPVVSSNTLAVKEVVKDFALTTDALDVQGFTNHIKNIFINAELAKSLSIEGKKRAKYFSWEKTGEETIKAYMELYSKL